jgi:hemerythrin-like metal-binding protein
VNRNDADLALALQVIFGDHVELAELVAKIRGAIDGADYRRVKDLLLSLQGLEETHYRSEDDLMQRLAYDEFARHHAEHSELIGALCQINRTLAIEPGGTISDAVVLHLERAASHMLETDGQLKIYVQRRQARADAD